MTDHVRFHRAVRAAGQALAGLALLAGMPASGRAQLATPTTWRWITDRPVRLVTTQAVPDSAWRFVAMPPGWHVTTGPGVTLYDPANSAAGRFAVESEVFLFPGAGQEGYGLFIGGRGLEGAEAEYLAFLVRRDGHAKVEHRQGGTVRQVMPWTANTAVTPYPGRSTGRNILRVGVEADSLVFSANGERVFALSRGVLPADGHFGFRIGTGIDLHVSTLDLTRRLAPPRGG